MTNRFKGSHVIEYLINYGGRFVTLFRKRWSRSSPRKINAKGKMVVWGGLSNSQGSPRSLRYSLRRLSFSKGFSFLSELSWGSLLTVHCNVDRFFFSINLRTPPASMHYPVSRLLPHFLGIFFNSSPPPGPISVLVHLGCYNINTIDWVTYEQKNFFLTLLEV